MNIINVKRIQKYPRSTTTRRKVNRMHPDFWKTTYGKVIKNLSIDMIIFAEERSDCHLTEDEFDFVRQMALGNIPCSFINIKMLRILRSIRFCYMSI